MSGPRLRSLDIFRGATVALMILVNNPGSWAHIYPPLDHAAWHGATPTDLVFPFFLFAVGNALAIVMPGLQAQAFWPRVLRRTALIFAIGLFLNASPFVRWSDAGELVMRDWGALRFMGVLQRIALGFGAAAVIVKLFGARRATWVAAGLLVGYWLVCMAFGDYTLQGWFGTAVDKALLGERHLYRGEGVPFDPEGLASTAPAVAQVLLGFWVGEMVRRQAPDEALIARLFVAATALLVLAYLWQLVMPVNKKIWTSSYVLLTTGLAMMALAALLHVVELRRRGFVLDRFFEVFGRNALAVFVLSGFLPRVLALLRWREGDAWTSPLPWLYKHVFAITPDPRLGSLAFAAANVAAYGALAWWLDRRRIYIKV